MPRPSTDYQVGENVQWQGMTLTKKVASAPIAGTNEQTMEMWENEAGKQFEPALVFSTGIEEPYFLPLPDPAD